MGLALTSRQPQAGFSWLRKLIGSNKHANENQT